MKSVTRRPNTVVIVMVAIAVMLVVAFMIYYKLHQQPSGVAATDMRYEQILSSTVDSLSIIKKDRLMCAYCNQHEVKRYRVSLGSEPKGAKHFEGDGKTPEGKYYISVKNKNSLFHKSLGISYPAEKDRKYAKDHNQPTGGDIMIHGLPNRFKGKAIQYTSIDWTAGCISINNQQIDELFEHVQMRTPVTILP